MKLKLTFKTPDVMEQLYFSDPSVKEYDPDFDYIKASLAKFITYNEYVTIEFDTEEQTATVIGAN